MENFETVAAKVRGNQRITDANPPVCKLTGYALEERLGRKTIELMASNHLPAGVHPFDEKFSGFGLGVSVLPRDALTPKYHSRLVVPVPFTRPAPSRRIALAWRKSFPRPEAITAIRAAVAVCRPKPTRQAPARPVRKGNP